MKVVLAPLDWKSQFPNTKFQINSKYQHPMTRTSLTSACRQAGFPSPRWGEGGGEGTRPTLFGIWNSGDWGLFVIWCLPVGR